MYIYNVTINVDEPIHDEWLSWMKKEHIPAMLATGKFIKALMTRVRVEDMEGISYSVQYTARNKETLQEYYSDHAATLRAHSQPFEGRFVAFRTELEVVGEYSHNRDSKEEE